MKPGEIEAMEEVIETLNVRSHYQYGQILRYRLMLEYGFKSEVLIDLRLEQFDEKTYALEFFHLKPWEIW